ncbi:MAG TPA: AI-2E family transporter [Steroidobacteraceae bacterium]|nr:AI-2E family transporter [Steroidobacteraceae bacterium]
MDTRTADRDSGVISLPLRRTLLIVLAAALALLCLVVLRPFLSSMLWAATLAYVTWPVYRRLPVALRKVPTAAASVMTLLVAALAVLPLFWLLVLVQRELFDAYRQFTLYLGQGPHTLPAPVRDIPWLGPWLQDALERYASDPTMLAREVADTLRGWRGELGALLGGVARNVGKLVITSLTLFFFYRDGAVLVRQLRRIAERLFDGQLDRFAYSAGLMTRAVVYGTLITALVQGVIAGLGYWVVGLQAPALLGGLTGVLSAAPSLGTAFVWAPLAVGLIVAGHTWKGLLLLGWGALLVHPVDNLLRPLMISSVTRVPFLLAMFGALGGLAAFGLIGVFIGPILLAVASAVWQEWAAE